MSESHRKPWLNFLQKLIQLPLERAAEGQLRGSLPHARAARPESQPLECMARILTGISPWLFVDPGDKKEAADQERFRNLFAVGLEKGADPGHPDFWGFGRDMQSVVDTAFLVAAFLRTPALLTLCSDKTRALLLANFLSTRRYLPYQNNWLLFSAAIEAGIELLGGKPDEMRVDYALTQHEAWYVGDGWYKDGSAFHLDFYNSLVIHPFLRLILDHFQGRQTRWDSYREALLPRSARLAQQLERMIGADGSWPPLGRSLAYRCGVFFALADAAWREELPEGLSPGSVRGALTAAIQKSLDHPNTFDREGWIAVGLSGNQPAMGENYISPASCYLCLAAFLPLGLSPEAPFWVETGAPWTQVRLWNEGEDLRADKAIVG